MATIEDKILKANIPGKYSWWKGEDDDNRPDDKDADDESDKEEETDIDKMRRLASLDVPEPIRRAALAEHYRKHNTGVKGVIEDYKEHKAIIEANDKYEAQLRDDTLNRIAYGSKISQETYEGPGIADDIFQMKVPASRCDVVNRVDAEADDFEDEDTSFLAEYRAKRLEQMKSSAHKPSFGEIREIESEELVDEVDKVDPRTSVVVHMYDPRVSACNRMNIHLEVLARRHPMVKFLRMGAPDDYDSVALPTVMIYRAGDVVEVVAAAVQELGQGQGFSIEAVEEMLEQKDVFE